MVVDLFQEIPRGFDVILSLSSTYPRTRSANWPFSRLEISGRYFRAVKRETLLPINNGYIMDNKCINFLYFKSEELTSHLIDEVGRLPDTPLHQYSTCLPSSKIAFPILLGETLQLFIG